MKKIVLLFGVALSSVTLPAIPAPYLYLGPGMEHLRPEIIQAAKLVAAQPECLNATDGAWGEAGKDIEVTSETGIVFRITCEVADVPGNHDNFWVPQNNLKREAIYRQVKRAFLGGKK